MPTSSKELVLILRMLALANIGMFVVAGTVVTALWYGFSPLSELLFDQAVRQGYCSTIWIDQANECALKVDTLAFVLCSVFGFLLGGFLFSKLKKNVPAITGTYRQGFVATFLYPCVLFFQHVVATAGLQYDWERQAASARVFSWMGRTILGITIFLILFNIWNFYRVSARRTKN